MGGKIRVVIADDSSMARVLLRNFLEEAEGIEVVGEAANGRQAVQLAQELKPDLMTMDLEMPGLNGLQAIDEIMHSKAIPILVVSSVADAQHALEAVGHGALEVVNKPDFSTQEAAEFVAKVRLLAGVSVVTRMRPRKAPSAGVPPLAPAAVPAALTFATAAVPAMAKELRGDYLRVFAIASSTGGPQALAEILSALPADFPCPVLVSQHISDGFAGGMAEWLSTLTKIPVRVAIEGELLRSGVILLSPSERHMSVLPTRRIALLERTPADVYHPSCDVLLASVADVFARQAIGIILTGMGRDGARGIQRIRERGGATVAQDEASSVIYGMNRVAVETGAVQQVLPVGAVAATMRELADPFRAAAAQSGAGALA